MLKCYTIFGIAITSMDKIMFGIAITSKDKIATVINMLGFATTSKL
jgi:hypothetical protein